LLTERRLFHWLQAGQSENLLVTAAKLVQSRQQLSHGWFFDDFKRPMANQVQVNFFSFFQVKRLH